MGFFLTLFQVATEESFVGVIKNGLRAVAMTTRQPAGNNGA
jgi:hypothetical protein